MRILVIGNGFDLAHGLPTKYTDFLHSSKLFYEYHHNQALNNDFGTFFASKLQKNHQHVSAKIKS